MAKAPCARLTNPISPMVTDSPTETMNSTIPAASPPRIMLATSMPRIMPRAPRSPAWRDLLRLADVLDVLDRGEKLLVQLAVSALDHLDQVLVHHDVAGLGIDHHGSARAVECPALECRDGLVAIHAALQCLHGVRNDGHAV